MQDWSLVNYDQLSNPAHTHHSFPSCSLVFPGLFTTKKAVQVQRPGYQVFESLPPWSMNPSKGILPQATIPLLTTIQKQRTILVLPLEHAMIQNQILCQTKIRGHSHKLLLRDLH
eukprot:5313737-Ditylum_brightwellii.AAC.1